MAGSLVGGSSQHNATNVIAAYSSSSSCTSSSRTSSVLNQQSKNNNRWATSVRVDPKVPVEPVTPQAVRSWCHRGGKHLKMSNDTIARRQAPSRQHASAPNQASSSPQIVTYCCNVTVNLKNVGFLDSDSNSLVNQLEKSLFPSLNQPSLDSASTITTLGDTDSCQPPYSTGAMQSSVNSNDVFLSSSSTTVPLASDTVYFVSLDLSENQLTCEGIQTLMSWFIRYTSHVRLRQLKIYKNSVSDVGATAVANLVRVQQSALEELHLSHNRITDAGASALFKSFSHARYGDSEAPTQRRGKQQQLGYNQISTNSIKSYVYPRVTDARVLNTNSNANNANNNSNSSSNVGYLPVWIRLEYNHIQYAASVLQRWESDCRCTRNYESHLKLACFADRPSLPRGSKDPHCSPARCLRAGANHSPLLHLYSFYHQSSPTPPLASSCVPTLQSSTSFASNPTSTSNSRTKTTTQRPPTAVTPVATNETGSDPGIKLHSRPARRRVAPSKNQNSKIAGVSSSEINSTTTQPLSKQTEETLVHDETVKSSSELKLQSITGLESEQLLDQQASSRRQINPPSPSTMQEVSSCDDAHLQPSKQNRASSFPTMQQQHNEKSVEITSDVTCANRQLSSADNDFMLYADKEPTAATKFRQQLQHEDKNIFTGARSHLVPSSSSVSQQHSTTSARTNNYRAPSTNQKQQQIFSSQQVGNQSSPPQTLEFPFAKIEEDNDLRMNNNSYSKQQQSQRLDLIDSAVVGIGKIQQKSSNKYQTVHSNNNSYGTSATNTSNTGTPTENVTSQQLTQRSDARNYVASSQDEYRKNGAAKDSAATSTSFVSRLHQSLCHTSGLPTTMISRNTVMKKKEDSCKNTSSIENTVKQPSVARPSFSATVAAANESIDRTYVPPSPVDIPFGLPSQQQDPNLTRGGTPTYSAKLPITPSFQASAPSHLPLYIFLDASAFLEMRKLQKNNQMNLFSFPGFSALCEKQVLCHSSMTPITRPNLQRNNSETFDSNQSLILMIINSVEEGLLFLTENKPSLREELMSLHQNFIGHLGKLGVVESIEGLSGNLGDKWMYLDEGACHTAQLYGVPSDALRVIDFAFVWAYHLVKVSGATSTNTSRGLVHPSFALFVTSNSRVEKFFDSLNYDSSKSTNGIQRPSQNLLCMHLDNLNELLRDAFPNLSSMLTSSECFEPANTPYMNAKEILSASILRQLIQDYTQRFRSINQKQTTNREPSRPPHFGSGGNATTNNSDVLSYPTEDSFKTNSLRSNNDSSTDGSKMMTGVTTDKQQKSSSSPTERVTNSNSTTRHYGALDHPRLFEPPPPPPVAINDTVYSDDSRKLVSSESMIRRLQRDNCRWRNELQRAYGLVSDVIRFSETSPYNRKFSDVAGGENMLKRCRSECAHWATLLLHPNVYQQDNQTLTSTSHFPPGIPQHSDEQILSAEFQQKHQPLFYQGRETIEKKIVNDRLHGPNEESFEHLNNMNASYEPLDTISSLRRVTATKPIFRVPRCKP